MIMRRKYEKWRNKDRRETGKPKLKLTSSAAEGMTKFSSDRATMRSLGRGRETL